ncbi:MAG TPA: ATP-binding cassette domain-containing protein [Candidatus Alectryocaccobium stercorigallinarum]|nr:ATP-binding cassette domain-containing protein [Candidatus Alectryocaccobium stercorigallinarum]
MERHDRQIGRRIKKDDERFSASFFRMAGVVMKDAEALALDHQQRKLSAIGEILRYYRIKPQELPRGIDDTEEQLDYLLRPSGMMRRAVLLDEGWHKRAAGAMLVKKPGGELIALIPSAFSGYMMFDPKEGRRVRVTNKTAKELCGEAIVFYRPLPTGVISGKELARYIFGSFNGADVFFAAAAALAAALIGLLPPYAVNLLFDDAAQSSDPSLIVPIICFLAGTTVSAALIGIARGMLSTRIKSRLDVSVSAAAMMRVLSLPPKFFRKYGAGELAARIDALDQMCGTAADAVFTSGLSAVFSIVYIAQIFNYAPRLTLPAACTVFATVICTITTVVIQARVTTKRMEESAKTDGLVFGMISGIQKIKTAGAEKRAFAKWADQYTKAAKLQYDSPAFLKLSSVIITAISLAGTIIIYYFAVNAQIPVSDYMAFQVSYGMMTSAFAALSSVAAVLANIKPVMDMVKPLLKETTETAQNKKPVSLLEGEIELDNVSFRYNDDTPMILDDISLKIRQGEYVGIAGRTGCGKSTLLRLLLGFETPCKGAVYYDEQDISAMDLQSLRRKIGVVMQDGSLFTGDIYSNIALSSPRLTLEEAWHAAGLAGIADDIRNMPMGMHTLVSEGNGGISGGQKQRLLIARAVAGNPKILMFDEATSALDNITQKQISDALAKLKCTRIVIAHRLSTVAQCDRILVMDGGRIAEEGTYDELLAKDGIFAELVRRQLS